MTELLTSWGPPTFEQDSRDYHGSPTQARSFRWNGKTLSKETRDGGFNPWQFQCWPFVPHNLICTLVCNSFNLICTLVCNCFSLDQTITRYLSPFFLSLLHCIIDKKKKNQFALLVRTKVHPAEETTLPISSPGGFPSFCHPHWNAAHYKIAVLIDQMLTC